MQIHEPGQTPMPHDGDKLAVGIDLGTTNSLVAVSRGEKPEVLRDEHGKGIVPSIVCFGDDEVLVGEAARLELLEQPDRVISSIKRLMGRGIEDVKSLAGTLPFDVDRDKEGGMVRLKIAGRSLSPVEISAEILKHLKGRAEEALDKEINEAVITVPAYFDDAARSATKDAAKLAGLDVLRLVNEPTAAALAYGLDQGAEGLFAVYDLGGGTFDISILKMEKGVFQVLATGGDAVLGGDDLDHAVAEHFLAERKEKLGDETLNATAVKSALQTARLAKECLSKRGSGKWVLSIGDKTSEHELTREQLEELITPLVKRTVGIIDQVLEDAEIFPEDVKGVVMVGGSTRVPLVRKEVGDYFGCEPLCDLNPDEVVALGASLQAEALTVGSDTLLLDVTPLSLGIETMGGIVEKIIPRNSPIPTAKAQEFTTYQDGQTAMAIHAVQGEREMVDQCRSLARFELHGIPPMTAGAARIRVTFQVDADGLLTVKAREETTGTEQQIEVKPSYGLSDDEMATMLRDSMMNARQDMEVRLLAEERVEAERVLLALNAALEVDGDLVDDAERAEIVKAMEVVILATKGEDRAAIHSSVEALDRATQNFAQLRMDKSIGAALEGQTVDGVAEAFKDEETES